MEKKDLLKKQELAEELGMKFDEASELFSEETLETMRMMNVVGGSGDGDNNVDRCGCTVNSVDRCGCGESTNKNCKDKTYCPCTDKSGDKCDKCSTTSTPGEVTPTSTPTITGPGVEIPTTTTI